MRAHSLFAAINNRAFTMHKLEYIRLFIYPPASIASRGVYWNQAQKLLNYQWIQEESNAIDLISIQIDKYEKMR